MKFVNMHKKINKDKFIIIWREIQKQHMHVVIWKYFSEISLNKNNKQKTFSNEIISNYFILSNKTLIYVCIFK